MVNRLVQLEANLCKVLYIIIMYCSTLHCLQDLCTEQLFFHDHNKIQRKIGGQPETPYSLTHQYMIN